jgi:hypothetical protein
VLVLGIPWRNEAAGGKWKGKSVVDLRGRIREARARGRMRWITRMLDFYVVLESHLPREQGCLGPERERWRPSWEEWEMGH